MRLSPLPVLLVLASCQFDPTGQEVELLPEVPADDLRFADADETSTDSDRVGAQDASGIVQPQVQIGPWNGQTEGMSADSLAARLQEEARMRKQAEADRQAALDAQQLAERELLAAQAAWIHQRKQNEELQEEREFLLQRIREFDLVMDHIIDFEEQNERLLGRISNLEMELYEARVYQPELADLSLEDAIRATNLALSRMAAEDNSIEMMVDGTTTGLRIDNRLLFDSGQIEIGLSGQEVLQDLAQELIPSIEAGGQLQIIGHTDSEPLSAQQHRFPLGNFQLSCRRALEVANCLIQAGIDPAQVSVSGVGEWQPIASNETEAGRSRNRRVEILVQMPDNPAVAKQTALAPDPDQQ